MGIVKLRTKVLEVEAVAWEGTEESAEEIETFVGSRYFSRNRNHPLDVGELEIWNEESQRWLYIPKGFYVIKDSNGWCGPYSPQVTFLRYEVRN